MNNYGVMSLWACGSMDEDLYKSFTVQIMLRQRLFQKHIFFF